MCENRLVMIISEIIASHNRLYVHVGIEENESKTKFTSHTKGGGYEYELIYPLDR